MSIISNDEFHPELPILSPADLSAIESGSIFSENKTFANISIE